jgi:pimeloyl-ACP methyl ester carboxylesterase
MELTNSRDGTTLAYDVAGDGPPLVYVTGACCHRRFEPVADDLKVFSTSFKVLGYDRRGRGDSGDTSPWSLDKEVEDLEAMIDALGGRAFVYGHSSGAVLALHAAHRLGEKVLGTVVYDASWVGDEAEREEYGRLRTRIDHLLDSGRHATAVRRFMRGIGMPRMFVWLLSFMPGWRTMVALAPTLRYDMTLTADLPPVRVVREVETPVHILTGERSPAEIHTVAKTLAHAIDGPVTTVPEQDHMVSAKVLLPELVARCTA